MPRYYYVPAENVEAERLRPGSQIRVPSTEGENDNLFLWGQAVYIISQLLRECRFGSMISNLMIDLKPSMGQRMNLIVYSNCTVTPS